MGNLILKWVSHLDAFSVYPFRISLPCYAVGTTTVAPVVRPFRSSRTTSGLRILVDSKVDYGKNRNQALTAVIFVTGLSGIKVNFGNVQLTGMVLACVVGMILSLIFYLFDKMKLTNDQ